MSKIVIIGGSFAAFTAFKTLYSHSSEFEVTLVAMNDHAFFDVAAPRLLVQPELLDKVFFPVEPFVKKVSKGKGKYVQGKAESVDFEANTVSVDVGGKIVQLDYDFLVVATGSKSEFAGWKVNASHEHAKAAIVEANKKIKTARSIAVLGGGPTGTEVAGELGDFAKNAEVTIYTGSAGPLAVVPKLSAGAEAKLAKLGVSVVNKVRYESITRDDTGATVVFNDGTTKKFDLVFEATKSEPYSQFLPSSVKDKAGWVETDKHLLVKGTSNVFAIGDVVAGSRKSLVDLKFGFTPVFSEQVKATILGQGGAVKEYSPVSNMLVVPISKNGGEGIVFGWSVPNFFVKFIKAKGFMINNAGETFQ